MGFPPMDLQQKLYPRLISGLKAASNLLEPLPCGKMLDYLLTPYQSLLKFAVNYIALPFFSELP